MMTWFCYWTSELTVVSVWMAMRSSIKVNLVRCEKLLKRKSGSVRGSILEYFTNRVLVTFYSFGPITEWISPSIISILIRLTDTMFKKNWDWPKTQALLILNSLRGEPCLKYSCYVLFNHTCHIRKSLCYPAQIMSPWDFLLSILSTYFFTFDRKILENNLFHEIYFVNKIYHRHQDLSHAQKLYWHRSWFKALKK